MTRLKVVRMACIFTSLSDISEKTCILTKDAKVTVADGCLFCSFDAAVDMNDRAGNGRVGAVSKSTELNTVHSMATSPLQLAARRSADGTDATHLQSSSI